MMMGALDTDASGAPGILFHFRYHESMILVSCHNKNEQLIPRLPPPSLEMRDGGGFSFSASPHHHCPPPSLKT